MPVAFTLEQKEKIRTKIFAFARNAVKEYEVSKISVRLITEAAGISKGAFYIFYDSKEQLFYELARMLHEEIIRPTYAILGMCTLSSAERITQAIISGCEALDKSGMERFLTKDIPDLMQKLPKEVLKEQRDREKEILDYFLEVSGQLAVPKEEAYAAINGLILTAFERKHLGNTYEKVLSWMAEGVCNRIFCSTRMC